jgi:hypothetical protein
LSGLRLARACASSIAVLVRHRAGALLPVVHGDVDLLVVLDQVGRDAGVGVPRGRALAALEVDLDRVGLGHVQDLVGDRLHFFA